MLKSFFYPQYIQNIRHIWQWYYIWSCVKEEFWFCDKLKKNVRSNSYRVTFRLITTFLLNKQNEILKLSEVYEIQ